MSVFRTTKRFEPTRTFWPPLRPSSAPCSSGTSDVRRAPKKSRIKYPNYIRNLITQKQKLFSLYKTNSAFYKSAYKQTCLQAKCALRQFHNHREEVIVSKGRLALYKFVSTKLNKNDAIHALVDEGNVVITEQEKCEALAKHFSTTFSIPPSEPTHALDELPCRDNQPLCDVDFSVVDVYRMLSSLPDRHGTSPDSISYKILKHCSVSLTHVVCELFRVVIDSGQVPAIWKTSIIVPIFKKGDPTNCSNYRPISLTCTLSRTLERIVVKAIVDHLLRTSFFSEDQFGFLKGRSTSSQLLATLDDWYSALESDSFVDAVYIDFAKAFDSVPHKELLYKVKRAGISGKILSYISSFLNGRSFKVRLNTSFSSSYQITRGVPQGSVLGPILFLIYINDLPTYIPPSVGIKLYADDVKLYKSHKNDASREDLQLALTGLERWSTDWRVNIAEHKCLRFHIGKNNASLRYTINGYPLPASDCIRDLGVQIDCKLSFSQHVSQVIRTAYFKAYQILHILKTRSLTTLILAYKIYVRPHLEYAVESWNPKSAKDIVRLERVQKFFTRKAFKKCLLRPVPYSTRLELCHLQSLTNRRALFDLAMTYKITHNQTSLDPSKYFVRSTRSRLNRFQLQKRKHKTKTQHNFFVRTVNVWNQLPNAIVESKSLRSFTHLIKLSSILPLYPVTT